MSTPTESRADKIREALRIINTAKKHDVLLRLIGGLAIRNHCEIIDFCERDYSDIDLVGTRQQATQISKVMNELGYQEDPQVERDSGGQRMQFHKGDLSDHIDVFLDTFQMEHTIDLRHRLSIENYTISISDLLLTKLQIYQLNEKDVRDILTIIKDIPIDTQDRSKVINVQYLAQLCSKDWGLYQDVITNIDKAQHLMNNYTLSPPDQQRIQQGLSRIKSAIQQAPKSLKWKIRARIGKRKSWRSAVENQSGTRAPNEQG